MKAFFLSLILPALLLASAAIPAASAYAQTATPTNCPAGTSYVADYGIDSSPECISLSTGQPVTARAASTGNSGTQNSPTAASTGNGGASGQTLANPLNGVDSLPELLTLVLQTIVKLGSILLVLAFMWIGFKFVAAQGNPKKIQEARSGLLWTIVGGLILLGAEGISQVVQATANSL